MRNPDAQEFFKMMLLTVVGQAFDAAGYTLDDVPMQEAGGQFRFVKSLDADLYGFIEYQHLSYTDTEWAPTTPSRFRVMLYRSDGPRNPRAESEHPRYAKRDLSDLVVEDFGVAILPSAGYWWTYSGTDELGKALAEAGHLVAGYGIPWLAGELAPPSG